MRTERRFAAILAALIGLAADRGFADEPPTPAAPLAATEPAAAAVTQPPPRSAAATAPAATRPVPAAVGLLVLEVQASRMPARPAADPTAAGVVVERARLAEPGAELHEALAETPGVRSVASGGAGRFATLSIRGSTAQQVVVTLDDVPLADGMTGLVDLGAIPVEELAAVEVYRGLSPLVVPTGAIGGAVRLRLPEPDRDRLTARLGAGSFGTRHGAISGAWRPTGRIGLGASVGTFVSQGDYSYASDNGTAFDMSDDTIRRRGNNDFTRAHGTLRLSAQPTEGLQVGLLHMAWQDSGGVPGHGLQNDTAVRREDRRFLTIASAAQPAWPGPGWQQRQQLWWLHARDQLSDPWAEFGPDRNDSDDRSDAWGGRWLLEGTPTAWLDLALMLSGGLERYAPTDALDVQPEGPVSTRTRVAAGLQPRIRLPWGRGIDVIPTARLERLDSEVHDYTFRGIALTPPDSGPRLLDDLRLGVRVGLAEGLDALANVGRAERAPTFAELFGDGAVMLPNGALLSETGRFADFGLRGAWAADFGWLAADLHGWLRDVEGLIQFERTSPQTIRADNLDGARMAGLEAGLVADLWAHLLLRGSYGATVTRMRSAAIARDGNELPFQPSSTWFLRVGPYRRIGAAWLRRVGVWAEGDWQAGSYLDAANRIVLPARMVVNTGADLAWLADDALHLQVTVRNVVDAAIVDLLGWPRPGRSLSAVLSWSVF
jgi:outer membrane cobalamin receptor